MLPCLNKTLFGFEDLLANELKQLGAQDVKVGIRNVTFWGDKGFMYKANMCLRTALKILKPIHSARIKNEHELYNLVYDFPWKDHLSTQHSFAVDSVVFGDNFTHSLYVSQKTKDAIVDRFRDQTGQRPNVDLRFPDLKINIPNILESPHPGIYNRDFFYEKTI